MRTLGSDGSRGQGTVAEHVWTVVCKDFAVDKESGNVTLFKALEQMSLVRASDETDASPPENIDFSFTVVSLWTRSNREEPEFAKARYVFRGPDGKTIGTSEEHSIDLKKYARHRTMSRLPGIGFKGFGRYNFVVQRQLPSGRWARTAVVPLEVVEGECEEP